MRDNISLSYLGGAGAGLGQLPGRGGAEQVSAVVGAAVRGIALQPLQLSLHLVQAVLHTVLKQQETAQLHSVF